jgi:hypothetical protein
MLLATQKAMLVRLYDAKTESRDKTLVTALLENQPARIFLSLHNGYIGMARRLRLEHCKGSKMAKFIETLLKDGPRFMQTAQRNWIGALFLIAVVVVIVGVPVMAAAFGAGRVATAVLK